MRKLNNKEKKYLKTIREIKSLDDIKITNIKVSPIEEVYDYDYDKEYRTPIDCKLNGALTQFSIDSNNYSLLSMINRYGGNKTPDDTHVKKYIAASLKNRVYLYHKGVDTYKMSEKQKRDIVEFCNRVGLESPFY